MSTPAIHATGLCKQFRHSDGTAWLPVANVLAWTVIFSLLALWGVRRSRART